MGGRRSARHRAAPNEPRRRPRDVGPTSAPQRRRPAERAVNKQRRPLAPAFYAKSTTPTRSAWADWWALLPPPYPLWHLSYVAIGATVAPRFDGGRLAATLVAFFLAVGVCAHNLDEL